MLLLSHPVGLSKTHGSHMFTEDQNLCSCRAALLYRGSLSNVFSDDSFLVGRAATIVPLVTSSHGNVRLDSTEPAGAADNSDVPAAAIFQARSFGSARGSSRSSGQVRHSRPSCSRPVARVHRRYRLRSCSSHSSFVRTVQECLCPCRHSQAVKPLWFGWTLQTTQYLVSDDR